MSKQKRPSFLANPLLGLLFNNRSIDTAPAVQQLLNQIAATPSDYAVLVPTTQFIFKNKDIDSNTNYLELAKDLDFLLSHIIRINAAKDPKIRSNKEYTTLSGKSIIIADNIIINAKGWKHDFKVKIISQNLLENWMDYVPFGGSIHCVFINEALVGNPKPIDIIKKNILFDEFAHQNSGKTVGIIDHDNIPKLPEPVSFDFILKTHPDVSELLPKFKSILCEFKPNRCKNLRQLHSQFEGIIKKGMAILDTLQAATLQNILTANSIRDYNEFQLSVIAYLESLLYDTLWPHLLRININEKDDAFIESYEYLQNVSITQIELDQKYLSNYVVRNEILKRTNFAIAHFKTIESKKTSSLKCSVVLETVRLLTTNTGDNNVVGKLDADSLLCLLIYVICHSKVTDIGNHLYYMHSYYNNLPLAPPSQLSEFIGLSTGYVGYILSTLEIALNYFSSRNHLEHLIHLGKENNKLWSLIGDVNEDRVLGDSLIKKQNKNENQPIFETLREIFRGYDDEFTNLSSWHTTFALNTTGESYLFMAAKRQNFELMSLIFEFDNLVTIDDLLDEIDIQGRTIFSFVLETSHPFASIFVDMLIENMQYDSFLFEPVETMVKVKDYRGKTFGHWITGVQNWKSESIDQILKMIDWKLRDNNGLSVLMCVIRSYDHLQYEYMLKKVLDLIKYQYQNCAPFKLTFDHLDSKKNSIIHAIRSPKSISYILKIFPGNELDLNLLNLHGLNPLSLAIKYSNIEKVKILAADERVDVCSVDPKTYLGAMDWIKVDRGGENDRKIENIIESHWNKDILDIGVDNPEFVCLRGRFEPDFGFCLHLRLNGEMKIISYSLFNRLLKFMKKENLWIPFAFDEQWLPNHLEVSMKGNILNSNKLKINCLVDNINIIWRCLKEMGILEHIEMWKSYLYEHAITSSKDLGISSSSLMFISSSCSGNNKNSNNNINHDNHNQDLMNMIQYTTSKNTNTRLSILENKQKFSKILITKDLVDSYSAFVDYSVSELTYFENIYKKLYCSLAFLNAKRSESFDVEQNLKDDLFGSNDAKTKCNLIDNYISELHVGMDGRIPEITYSGEANNTIAMAKEEMLWLVTEHTHTSYKRFLIKLRLLYCVVRDIICIQKEFKAKIDRWKKLFKALVNIRVELVKFRNEIIDEMHKNGESSGNDPNFCNTINVLEKIIGHIEALTKNSPDLKWKENLRKEVFNVIFQGDVEGNGNSKSPNLSVKSNASNESNVNEPLSTLPSFVNDSGIGSYFVEKRRLAYANKLLTTFFKIRLEILELNMDICKGYGEIAEFTSNFYEFRVKWVRNSWKKLVTDIIREKRDMVIEMESDGPSF